MAGGSHNGAHEPEASGIAGERSAVRGGGWLGAVRPGGGVRLATSDSFDGAFNWCRTYYRRNPPATAADGAPTIRVPIRTSSFRLAELTKTLISRDRRGDINHLVVALTQPELSRCPWIMMAEVGSLYLDQT